MAVTTEAKTTVGCFLVCWTDINPEQHESHISFDPPPQTYTPWSYRPKVLTVPAGWSVKMSNGDSLELYDDQGNHAQFVEFARHRKAVRFGTATGLRWLPMGDAESVCCPTCGHPME